MFHAATFTVQYGDPVSHRQDAPATDTHTHTRDPHPTGRQTVTTRRKSGPYSQISHTRGVRYTCRPGRAAVAPRVCTMYRDYRGRAAPASDSAPTAVEAPASDSAPTRGSGSDISERSICSVCPLSKRMVSVDGVLVRASCACAWSRPTLYMSVTVRNSPTRLTLPLTTRSTPYPWLPVSHPVPHTPHVSLAGAVRGLSLQT